MDWYFDIEATQEYLCMSISNSSININDTIVNQIADIGSWYGPLAVANWFTTPLVLLLTFYICCDFMSNTIFHRVVSSYTAHKFLGSMTQRGL